MSSSANHKLLLRACRKERVSELPVWMMRQAGRYLPEYRKIRQITDFTTMYKTPELAAEITLQPLRRFPLDAAIIFSDILVIPEAMGMPLTFVEKRGPQFEHPIEDPEVLIQLSRAELEAKLSFVFETIRLVRREVHPSKTVIGFSGSPWTLAVYMTEGGSSRDFRNIKRWRFQHGRQLHQLLDRLTGTVTDYLILQAKAGAEVLQIFDSWIGILDEAGIQEFILPYVRRIVQQVKQEANVPIIYFPKGGMVWLQAFASTGVDVISVDWTINLQRARREVNGQCAIQGNLDPTVLLTTPDIIKTQTLRMLQGLRDYTGYIVNLGHGILPQTPVTNAHQFIETVKQFALPAPDVVGAEQRIDESPEPKP